MKSIILHLLLFLLVWCVGACRRSPGAIDRQLVRAEVLMASQPDSCRMLLDSIDGSLLSTSHQRGLYALLVCEVGGDATADSVMRVATDYFDRTRDFHRRARAWICSAQRDLRSNRISSALRSYQEALEQSIKAADVTLQMFAHSGLCAVYRHQNMYNQAYGEALEAIELAQRANDSLRLPSMIQNLGAVYLMDQAYDSTLIRLKEGLHIALHTGNTSAVASIYNDIADTFISCREVDSALVYIRRSIPYYTGITPEAGDIMGWCFLERAQYDSAYYYFSLVSGQGDLTVQRSVLDGLKQLEEERGNYREALDYYHRYEAINDSLSNGFYRSEIVELVNLHHIQLQQSAQRRERIVFISLLTLLTVMSAVGFVIFRSRQKIKHLSTQLDLEQEVVRNAEIKKNLYFEREKKIRLMEERIKESSLYHTLLQCDGAMTPQQTDLLWELFNTLHDRFLHRLAQHAPLLRPADLTTCCLLKLGFGSTKIASLRGIDLHSIPRSKKNIASKLNLSSENGSLHLFLSSF